MAIILYGTLLFASPHHDQFGDGTRYIAVETPRAMYVCTERRDCWVWRRGKDIQ